MNPYFVGILVPFVVSLMMRKLENMKQRGFPVDVGGERGYAIRNYRFTSPVETAWEGISTLAELFEQSCKKYAFMRLLGTRQLISREMEATADGRSFEKLHLGSYEWLNYGQAFEVVCNFSSGLVALGHGRQERAAIFADTRAEWLIALQGCFRRNITVVTIYASLGEEALAHSLNETEVTTVICGHRELKKLADISGQLDTVKRVIYMNDEGASAEVALTENRTNWKLVSFMDVQRLGKESPVDADLPVSADIAVIMYTSGSTGMPKLYLTGFEMVLEKVNEIFNAYSLVDAKGGLSKKLFEIGYDRRLSAINGSWFGAWGLEKILWDFIVFRKVRAVLGGNIRFLLSGGAPLSADTQRFINICLGAPIGQGYGLTETCAGGSFTEYDDTSVGHVGAPLPCSFVKLIDWAEGEYRVTDSPMPRGEIIIGGPNVTAGYFKNEEKTNEVYKVDERGMRWFYTGDIGRFILMDALKLLIVEAALIVSPYVDNLMMFGILASVLVVQSRSEFSEDELLSIVTMKNGRKVACGTQTGALLLYSWGHFKDCSDRFLGHPMSVDTLLKIDEDTLISGSEDGVIRLVGILPNRIIHPIAEHSEYPIEGLGFSFDRKFLGSISHDQMLKLWDMHELLESQKDASNHDNEEMDVDGLRGRPANVGQASNTAAADDFFADL
ncbi:hypothetical protein QJS10_CPA08g00685 [Acorus calamus]|uniref:4-coumarate--CoA ligase n=1 Tax=Acorus calamus TaxID=4465 RepID=A0AAV9EBH8_ACOCL|nr:hypothetical protein QJS10_CPA08g00685 [Acorus calamus]